MGWSGGNKLEMKNWQRQQMSGKWKGNGGDEGRNCDGDCIQRDLERLKDEWKQ